MSTRAQRFRHAFWGAGLCAGILAAAACDGENVFEGEVAEDPPRITSIVAPASVTTPVSFDIDVFARARSGVAALEIQLTGAIVRTDSLPFDGTEEEVIATGTFDLDQATDSLLVIRAVVADITGRVSVARFDTVRVN